MKNMFTITMLLVVSLAASLAFSAPIIIGNATVIDAKIGVTNDAITTLSLFGKLNLLVAGITVETLSATTTVVNAGTYATTNLDQVEPNLVPGNIATNITIFGIAGVANTNGGGSAFPAPVQKSAQIASYAEGDDGWNGTNFGVAFPNPRFTVQANTNCVLDNLTGLIWARNANQFGSVNWSTALSDCNDLDYGGETDWRLPNLKELLSLIDCANSGPALPSGNPFTDVQSVNYWTSTAFADLTVLAWYVNLYDGAVNNDNKVGVEFCVWPVRSGQ